MQILLRTPNYLGDAVMITPALDLLRQALPDTEFWFWGPAFNAELFGQERNYGGSLVHPKGQGWRAHLSLIASLRAKKFDAAILFASQARDAAICRIARIPRVVGTVKGDTRLLLDAGVRYEYARHRVNHFALLAETAFPSGMKTMSPLRLAARSSDLVGAFCSPRIGLLLGGPHKGLRAYPPELAAQLVSRLAALSGHVFVLGDRTDADAAARWLPEQQYGNVHVLAGKTTVGGLADVVSGLDAVVTIDTGVLHLAAALNVPFVSLVGFGTSAYGTVRPPNARGIHLAAPDTVLRDEDRIRSIHPEQIVSAVQCLLNPQAPPLFLADYATPDVPFVRPSLALARASKPE